MLLTTEGITESGVYNQEENTATDGAKWRIYFLQFLLEKFT